MAVPISYPFLVSLPGANSQPARYLRDGADSFLVMAANEADALAMVVSLTGGRQFAGTTVLPLEGTPNMLNWTARCRIYNTDGTTLADVSVKNTSSTADVAATGNATFSSTSAANGDSLTINNVAISFVTAGAIPGNNQLNVTGVPATDAAAVIALVNANNEAFGVTAAAGTTGQVLFTAVELGVVGNSIPLAKSGTNIAVSGATLSGGTSANKLSTLMGILATALNASGKVANAAFSSPTLTVAGTADNVGDHTFSLEFYRPSTDYVEPNGVPVVQGVTIPGFVISKTQGGSASAALTAKVQADNYPVPFIALKARSQ